MVTQYPFSAPALFELVSMSMEHNDHEYGRIIRFDKDVATEVSIIFKKSAEEVAVMLFKLNDEKTDLVLSAVSVKTRSAHGYHVENTFFVDTRPNIYKNQLQLIQDLQNFLLGFKCPKGTRTVVMFMVSLYFNRISQF